MPVRQQKSTNFQVRTLPRVGHCLKVRTRIMHRDMTSVRVARMDALSPQEHLPGVRSGFSRAADDERALLSFLTLSFKGAIRRATDREVVVQKIGYV